MRAPISFPALTDLAVELPAPPEFTEVLANHGLELDDDAHVSLRQFVGLLSAARPLLNVTALREPDDLWMKLVLDALLLLPALSSLDTGAQIVDVGCGGGFPGLPLAIVAPHLKFTLLDATAKKIAFVAHIAEQLRLDNVSPVVGRAETLTAPAGRKQSAGSHRERYDLVTARAVAALPLLLELTSPFAKPPRGKRQGGQLLLVKGQGADDELKLAERAMRELCVRKVGMERMATGTLIRLEKTAPTPVCYPRANGLPKRQPL